VTTARYPSVPAPASTPLPKQIAREVARRVDGYHTCLFPDTEILLEDVRQCRKRRVMLTTLIATVMIGSIAGLGVWIYGVGESVGSSRTEMGYMQRAHETDRESISRNTDGVRSMERENATRYSEIQQVLTRLDARLENIERAVSKRR